MVKLLLIIPLLVAAVNGRREQSALNSDGNMSDSDEIGLGTVTETRRDEAETGRRGYREEQIRKRHSYKRNEVNKEEAKDPFAELLTKLNNTPSTVAPIENLNDKSTNDTDTVEPLSLSVRFTDLLLPFTALNHDSHEWDPSNENLVAHLFHETKEIVKHLFERITRAIISRIAEKFSNPYNERNKRSAPNDNNKDRFGLNIADILSMISNPKGNENLIGNYFTKYFKCYVAKYLRSLLDNFDPCKSNDNNKAVNRKAGIPDLFDRMPNISDQLRLSVAAITKNLADGFLKTNVRRKDNDIVKDIDNNLNAIAKSYYDRLVKDYLKDVDYN